MKKFYEEPDFDIVNVKLVPDVLLSSKTIEDPLDPSQGEDFEDFFS